MVVKGVYRGYNINKASLSAHFLSKYSGKTYVRNNSSILNNCKKKWVSKLFGVNVNIKM